jgi:hypothetical protein
MRGGDDEYIENGDVPGWVEPTSNETNGKQQVSEATKEIKWYGKRTC